MCPSISQWPELLGRSLAFHCTVVEPSFGQNLTGQGVGFPNCSSLYIRVKVPAHASASLGAALVGVPAEVPAAVLSSHPCMLS